MRADFHVFGTANDRPLDGGRSPVYCRDNELKHFKPFPTIRAAAGRSSHPPWALMTTIA
jgi:hypothetical protein